LAEQLDRFAQSSIAPKFVQGQIILDKILYNLDRAIDLYAFGKDDIREPEYRAVAYSYVINVITNRTFASKSLLAVLGQIEVAGGVFERSIRRTLHKIRWELFTPLASLLASPPTEGVALPLLSPNAGNSQTYKNAWLLVQQELFIQQEMEAHWTGLIETMAPDYVPYLEIVGKNGVIDDLMEAAIKNVGSYDEPMTILPRDLASSWEEIVTKGLPLQSRDLSSATASGGSVGPTIDIMPSPLERFTITGVNNQQQAIPITITIATTGEIDPAQLKVQTSNGLNLRGDARIDAPLIAQIPDGSYVSLTGEIADTSWVEVTVDNQTGWVKSEFLSPLPANSAG
jgi:Bacterial SH3 domain